MQDSQRRLPGKQRIREAGIRETGAAILDFYRSLSQGKDGHSQSAKKLVGEDVIKVKGRQKKDGKRVMLKGFVLLHIGSGRF